MEFLLKIHEPSGISHGVHSEILEGFTEKKTSEGLEKPQKKDKEKKHKNNFMGNIIR